MSATWKVDGEMTIYRAAELKPLLLQWPAGDAALEIDLSGVDEIDTAGVQLLLLARREAQGLERELRLVGRSRAVDDALTLLNLQAEFGAAA